MPSGPSARSNQIMLAVKWAVAACGAATPALAQQAPPAQPAQPQQVQEVVVTGSRILQSVAQTTQPLSVISSDQIEKTGLASVGDLLQRLTTGGKALNQKFNSSGNFGYPPDGGGIGAGSSQVDLRNLDSKRTLVMVDGLRWVNESSASGVSGSADLNTIPLAIIDHIEVLEDGASSIYGSDAIAGVVNIITRKKFEGFEVSGYSGDFSKGGRTTEASLSYDATEDIQLYAKGLFNNRTSTNQAAPEPIFIGPVAGTGGIADAISVSHLNPYNPFGIDLCAVASPSCGNGTANFFGVTRRP